MRIAVVSDIHGNVTAFDAVLADLRLTAPDLVLHGGDLTVGGSDSAEIVDQVRSLGWQGVMGNTDEMLVRPQSLEDYAASIPHLESVWSATRAIAAAIREQLGADRLEWLNALPTTLLVESLAVVHASPATTWRSPSISATAEELEAVYEPLEKSVTVFGHIHQPFIRSCAAGLVINSGCVSLSHDGDRRASYLLLDGATPAIRRVEYDVEAEVARLAASNLPHSDWFARTLTSASPQLP